MDIQRGIGLSVALLALVVGTRGGEARQVWALESRHERALVDRDGASITLDGRALTLAVAAIGRGDARPVHGVEVRGTSGDVVRELGGGVREWWRAVDAGLEHGVTLDARPPGEGELAVD